MKEKLKNKKIVYTIIGIVSVLLVALALTYAYWLLTKEQTGENVISSACLDIEITGEKNDIELGSQYPISDEDGEKLTPYEFTVTNNCNTAVDYQIALETMPNEDGKETLSASALKVMLDSNSAKTLDKYKSVDTTITDATASNKLGTGTLAASGSTGASATHKLRIWIDANAPIGEMNRTFTGKVSVTIGQGIVKSDTMKNLMLASAGGESEITSLTSTQLTETKTKNVIVREKIDENDEYTHYYYLNNDMYFATEYTYDESTNKFKLSGDMIKSTILACYNSSDCKNNYKYTVFGSSQDSTSSTLGTGIEYAEYAVENDYVLVSDATIHTLEYEFSNVDVPTHEGIFKTNDDFGTSYYYRGDVKNNYVKFGTYSKDTTISYYDTLEYTDKEDVVKAGTPMYWRIVRVNGDGSIRLIYDGTQPLDNYKQVIAIAGYVKFNDVATNISHFGYTYDDGTGTQVDSTMKTFLDDWYDEHLAADYGGYFADEAIFCNDRTEGTVVHSYYNLFAASVRMSSNSPVLTCPSDYRYSTNSKFGNGFLSNSIGLITTDEALLSGIGNQMKSYMSKGGMYWTMTPSMTVEHTDSSEEFMYTIYHGEHFYGESWTYPNSEFFIRPVINLRADVEFTGEGTMTSPYEVVMN